MPNLPELARHALYRAAVATGGGHWALEELRGWSARVILRRDA